ncbi:hypothetical protein CY34DRAFT_809016 [Suillus luteus UH-Slu-Lm8-n1]|uniref:Uncharacterized protein n=1 Tax=Suillus luteus UH-Slu-Lm8-n1 TaxID=930992 RepID=A0A0C9ZM97_9AGAM|nr:hypothetical protein CY34DRAFT_809016 [Suillus luteus UH-Slu-Lm8-n1]
MPFFHEWGPNVGTTGITSWLYNSDGGRSGYTLGSDRATLIQRATTFQRFFPYTVTILLTRLAYMHKERYTHRYIPDFTRWPSSPYITVRFKTRNSNLYPFKTSVKLSDLFEGYSLSGAHDIQDTLATHNPRNQSITAPIFELRLSFLKRRHGSFLNHLASQRHAYFAHHLDESSVHKNP